MSFQVCELFICGVSSSWSLQSKFTKKLNNTFWERFAGRDKVLSLSTFGYVTPEFDTCILCQAQSIQSSIHQYVYCINTRTHARTHAHTHTYAPTRETYYTWENAVEWLHTFQRSVTKMKCKCLISLPCLVKMSLDVNNIIIQKDCILECCYQTDYIIM